MEITDHTEQWLYRIDEQIFGPVSTRVLAERILSGKISPEIHVARNQGEFHHITRLSEFRETLEKRNLGLAGRRKSVERTRRVLSILLLAVGAVTAFFVVDERATVIELEQTQEREQVLESRVLKAAASLALPLPELEALVSAEMLDAAQAEYDERRALALKAKPKRTRKKRVESVNDSQGALISDSCELTDQSVMRVMKKHIGAITSCVEGEKTRAAATGSTMPDMLTLSFTVRASGQVIQFELDHSAYRKGLLYKCLKKAFKKVIFPKRAGTDCPTNLPIRIPK